MNERLKKISGGDAEMVMEFISIFLECFPDQENQLGEAVYTSDFKGVRSIVHSMEGSLPAVGSALSIELLGMIGEAARSEDGDNLKKNFQTFKVEMDKVTCDLSVQLGGRKFIANEVFDDQQ